MDINRSSVDECESSAAVKVDVPRFVILGCIVGLDQFISNHGIEE
jgi:hypothetical protein